MVGVLGLVAGCVGPRKVSDKDIKAVSMAQVLSLVETQEREADERVLLLIDARTAAKYAAGHLPGAEHHLLSAFDPSKKRDKRLDSYDKIVVYADNPGSASAKGIVKRMLALRYDDVRLFAGGYDQWTRSGLDVEVGE